MQVAETQDVSLNKKDSDFLTPNMCLPSPALSYSPKGESTGLGQGLWKGCWKKGLQTPRTSAAGGTLDRISSVRLREQLPQVVLLPGLSKCGLIGSTLPFPLPYSQSSTEWAICFKDKKPFLLVVCDLLALDQDEQSRLSFSVTLASYEIFTSPSCINSMLHLDASTWINLSKQNPLAMSPAGTSCPHTQMLLTLKS